MPPIRAGRGSEMGIPEEKVVCLEGQRQVAAIALRAPCSGIEIQDGKQTNKNPRLLGLPLLVVLPFFVPNRVIIGDLSWHLSPKVVLSNRLDINFQPQSGRSMGLTYVAKKHLKHTRELTPLMPFAAL